MGDWVNQWIAHYGVLGVFIAAAIEGELGVLVGGAMARLGKLDPYAVAAAAWAAAFLSGELFFYAGRARRDSKWVHKVTDKRAFALAIHWIERHPRPFCLLYRFVYGFRIVGPVAIGLSQVGARTFAIANLASSAVWAAGGVWLGWAVGPSVARGLGQFFTREHLFIASVVATFALMAVVSIRARRSAARITAAARAKAAVDIDGGRSSNAERVRSES